MRSGERSDIYFGRCAGGGDWCGGLGPVCAAQRLVHRLFQSVEIPTDMDAVGKDPKTGGNGFRAERMRYRTL
jgi:hypothetical protein